MPVRRLARAISAATGVLVVEADLIDLGLRYDTHGRVVATPEVGVGDERNGSADAIRRRWVTVRSYDPTQPGLGEDTGPETPVPGGVINVNIYDPTRPGQASARTPAWNSQFQADEW